MTATISGSLRRQAEQGVRAGHHVNAGRHHCGSVDQGRHRRRTFHRVRQPYVQGELRGLAGRADEQHQRHHAENAEANLRAQLRQLLVHVQKADRAEEAEHHEHPQDEAGVPDAVHDERLVGCVAGRLLVEVEPDQQVAAQADAFPADEQQQVVVRQHQHQHEEHEQVQISEKAVVASLVGHVADGVDVDQEAHAGNHQNHHRAEWIQQEAPIGAEAPQRSVGQMERQSAHPGVLNHLVDFDRHARQFDHRRGGEEEREQHHARAKQADEFSPRVELLAHQQHHGRAEEREQWNQPDKVDEAHCAVLTTSADPPRRPAPFPCCGTARAGFPAPPRPRPPRP